MEARDDACLDDDVLGLLFAQARGGSSHIRRAGFVERIVRNEQCNDRRRVHD
jgi:hypothetical protein